MNTNTDYYAALFLAMFFAMAMIYGIVHMDWMIIGLSVVILVIVLAISVQSFRIGRGY